MVAPSSEHAAHDGDRAAIAAALHRFSRAVDRKRWDDIPPLATTDASFDYGIFKGGVPELVAWMAERHGHIVRSFHSIGSILVEFAGEAALCETYVISSQRIPGTGFASGLMDVLAAGRYIDVFVEQDGWKLARRHFIIDNSSTFEAVDGGANAMNWGRRDDQDILWLERERLGISQRIAPETNSNQD